jgi:Prealbumin-like fold domain
VKPRIWTLLALVMSGVVLLVAAGAMGANPAANLDQCANFAANPPGPTSCSSADPTDWVNGNLGSSKAKYFEGDSIPYRLRFSNLSLGSHKVTIEWDTTQGGKHALDYLTTFNRTVSAANPCAGVSGCGSPTTFAIPQDPNVTGAGVTPVAGNFTLYNGTITAASAYTLSGAYSGNSSTRITITFTASTASPVLAWGGHIATRLNWGSGFSAVAISGSPFHTRLIDLDGGGGNQDRSLSNDAVVFPGSITIVKKASPQGATSFPYTASPSPLANFSLVDDGTSANTKAFANITSFVSYSVTEGSVSGWTLNGVSCSVVSPNGGTQTQSGSTETINLKEGENVTCTFSNTRQAAHLIVIKHVVNDNGGSKSAADFTMTVSGTAVGGGSTSFSGAESPGTDVALAPGSYSVGESGPSGYSQSLSADCSGSILAGQTKTCTVTNDDQAAHLIVIKHVINNNGGSKTAADFTMTVIGSSPSPASFAGAESPGTNVTLGAGSYSVGESGPSGYAASYSADCTGSIANGETKTCTVTNDDIQPKLIVIKHVVNDNGGSKTAADFTMSVTGSSPSPSSFPGAESPGTNVALNAGSYSVGESGPSGYSSSMSSDCSGSIAVGETKTCTVTNDDKAGHLIVIKHVINDNGGSKTAADFTMTVIGSSPSPGSFAGAESPGTNVTLSAGSYSVGESGPSGYAASYSADCTGSIANGETKTCTVTNDDIQPKLIVIKHVDNSNGGSKTAADFTMKVTGSSPSPGSFPGAESPGTSVALNAGSYSVDEDGPLASYASSFSADCSGSIAVGETKTCTVTNTHTKAVTSTSTAQHLLPNDSASIGGRDPVGGKAKFELFAPGDDTCSGNPAFTQTVDVVGGQASTSNDGFVASAEGTWRWKVSYLGDDENQPSTSDCGVERFTIANG